MSKFEQTKFDIGNLNIQNFDIGNLTCGNCNSFECHKVRKLDFGLETRTKLKNNINNLEGRHRIVLGQHEHGPISISITVYLMVYRGQ